MKKVLFVALLASVALSASAKKKLAITMTGENLATLTQVTDNQEPCLDPFGGDNGSALFFSVRENGRYYNIYKKDNPFSAAMSQKTSGKNVLLGNGYQPCFSPNGKKIAYVKYSSDAKSTSIWIMNVDGSEQVQLTDAKKGYALNPRWSPDGTRLIFQSSKKDKKDFDLYVIDVDGNNLTQLTINKSYDGQPYWTTDGYIYFVSDRGNEAGNYQIWRFKYE